MDSYYASKTGIVKLLDKNMQSIQMLRYTNRSHRKAIIKNWNVAYGKMFLSMAIQIVPDTDVRIKNNNYAPKSKRLPK
jgi:hypothetical protein